MSAALDWSYGLLTEAEQKVLRRVAIFAGGFHFACRRHGDRRRDALRKRDFRERDGSRWSRLTSARPSRAYDCLRPRAPTPCGMWIRRRRLREARRPPGTRRWTRKGPRLPVRRCRWRKRLLSDCQRRPKAVPSQNLAVG